MLFLKFERDDIVYDANPAFPVCLSSQSGHVLMLISFCMCFQHYSFVSLLDIIFGQYSFITKNHILDWCFPSDYGWIVWISNSSCWLVSCWRINGSKVLWYGSVLCCCCWICREAYTNGFLFDFFCGQPLICFCMYAECGYS